MFDHALDSVETQTHNSQATENSHQWTLPTFVGWILAIISSLVMR